MSRCMSTLQPRETEGFSSGALRRLSDGRKLPTHLPLVRDDIPSLQLEQVQRISISGVQDKLSLRLHRGVLEPSDIGGTHILKPVPGTRLPVLHDDLPANEHLTMQLAEQCFGIRTAANTCIRLADGELAYLTRRFDRLPDGGKTAQEDFCQLMERTEATHGKQFKYGASYEELGRALERFCPAYAIEVEELFRRIVFCYATSNGDAHLKNFSLQQTPDGDHRLSPAYDLVATSIHLPGESRLALEVFDEGLTEGEQTAGFVTGSDLLELGRRYRIAPRRAEAIVALPKAVATRVHDLVDRSFLSARAKADYRARYDDRLLALSR